MTDFGYAKIKEAKENGQWDNVSKLSAITDKQIEELIKLLKENRCAYENFQHMSLSVKKHILKLIQMLKLRLDVLNDWHGLLIVWKRT